MSQGNQKLDDLRAEHVRGRYGLATALVAGSFLLAAAFVGAYLKLNSEPANTTASKRPPSETRPTSSFTTPAPPADDPGDAQRVPPLSVGVERLPDTVNRKQLERGTSSDTEYARILVRLTNRSDRPMTVNDIRLVVRGHSEERIENSTMAHFVLERSSHRKHVEVDDVAGAFGTQKMDEEPHLVLPGTTSAPIEYRFVLRNRRADILELTAFVLATARNGIEASSEEFDIVIQPDSPEEVIGPVQPAQ